LFTRDGQVLRAWLVDAGTSEIHPQLGDGMRQHDIDFLVDNVAGGMIDLATRLGWEPDVRAALMDESWSVATRCHDLWDALHGEPIFSFADRYRVEGQIRRLHDLGFAVDEVSRQPAGDDDGRSG
jgi:hypothetical protein